MNSRAETIISKSDNDDVFESVYSTIISNIQKNQGKGWDYSINIWKYNPVAGTSYTKLPKELNHPQKDLINI